jgi:hypothetical protein
VECRLSKCRVVFESKEPGMIEILNEAVCCISVLRAGVCEKFG